MKNKKITMYIIIIFIILVIAGLGYLVYINLNKEDDINKIKEYTPQEEITELQMRMTNIEVYFLDKNTNNLEKEIRQIDAKELIENPAKRILEELLKGPNEDKNSRIIPNNTKINSVKIEKGILFLDFSNEFIEIECAGRENETLILESLKKTMGQLLEINSIKILINGQENMEFEDGEINFKELIKIK